MQEYYTAIIIAIIAALPGTLNLLLQRRKNIVDVNKVRSEEESVIVDTVLKLLQPLRDECDHLINQRAELENALRECRKALEECENLRDS